MNGEPTTAIPFYGNTGFIEQHPISNHVAIARRLATSRQLSQVPLDKAGVPGDLVSLLQSQHFIPDDRNAPNLAGGIVAFYGVMIAALGQETYSPSKPALFVTQAVVVTPDEKEAILRTNTKAPRGWAQALSVVKSLVARHSLDVTLSAIEAPSRAPHTISLQFESGDYGTTGYAGSGSSCRQGGRLARLFWQSTNDAQWISFEKAFTPMLDALQGEYPPVAELELSAVGSAAAYLAKNQHVQAAPY